MIQSRLCVLTVVAIFLTGCGESAVEQQSTNSLQEFLELEVPETESIQDYLTLERTYGEDDSPASESPREIRELLSELRREKESYRRATELSETRSMSDEVRKGLESVVRELEAFHSTDDTKLAGISSVVAYPTPVDLESLPSPGPLPAGALGSLATSLMALQACIEVHVNNLANVNTIAFKMQRPILEDLPYRHDRKPGEVDGSGNPTAVGVSVGGGVRLASVQGDFNQGAFQDTGRELDVAIVGKGFFQVTDGATSETYYTRAGNLSVNANGDLVAGSASSGRVFDPTINIPQNATAISISGEGVVSYVSPGTTSLTEAGTMNLASFVNPEGLLRLGENMFKETEASGSPTVGTPQQDGLGAVRQSYLEASNVEPVREIIEMKRYLRTLRTVRWLLLSEK